MFVRSNTKGSDTARSAQIGQDCSDSRDETDDVMLPMPTLADCTIKINLRGTVMSGGRAAKVLVTQWDP